MNKFDLEKSVATWKKSLWKQQGLEPGFIEELEGNLRDRIEDYLDEGISEEEAFRLAVGKSMPQPQELASEYYKASTGRNSKPPWQRKRTLLGRMPMHLKVAVRNLLKRKAYSALNLGGLAISICVSFFIWIYVQDQSSYDQHYENADRIYRVIYDVTANDEKITQADVGQPVGPTLVADYPEVLRTTRIRRIRATNTLETDLSRLESADIFVADTAFFSVFDIDLVAGDRETALDEPKTILLSENMAMRFFGRTDVVGQMIRYFGVTAPMDIKVTGVFKDLDKHTHLPFEALVSYGTYFGERDLANWLRKSYTYIMLDETNNISSLESKIPDFNRKYLDEVFTKIGAEGNLLFQPLTSIYLHEGYLGEPYPHGSSTNLEILKAIMFFLLAMSCINYINMATARSADRAKEVGIKKTLGSTRPQLLAQFITEAVLLALVAGVLAIGLSLISVSYYVSVTNLEMSAMSFFTMKNVGAILLISASIGLLAGLYPALHLSAFSPVAVLKGKFSAGSKGISLRKVLIISQYAISSVLISGILVVASQTHFIKTKDVGFAKSSLIELAVPNDQESVKNMPAFITQVRNMPGIRAVTHSRQDLHSFRGIATEEMIGPDGQPIQAVMSYIYVGEDFVESIGGEILRGRGFDTDFVNNWTFLINETAAKEYGWTGEELDLKWKGWNRDENWTGIGVVKDFNLGESYREQVPMMLIFNEYISTSSNVFIGTVSDDARASLAELQSLWESRFPAHDFEYNLVEDRLAALYEGEELFLDLVTALGFIVAFITAIGITGLISFTTEMRRKEIALRKISGARIREVLLLLSKQFLSLLTIATLLSVPIGYYLSEQWLANFAIRVDFSIWPFLFAIPLCIVLTGLAVSHHALRAARANPVDALRTE